MRTMVLQAVAEDSPLPYIVSTRRNTQIYRKELDLPSLSITFDGTHAGFQYTVAQSWGTEKDRLAMSLW